MRRYNAGMKRLDLTGQTFGDLTVIEFADKRGKHVRWKCLCACGNTSFPTTTHLRSGHSVTCGCGVARANSASTTTHGFTKGRRCARIPPPREYRAWVHAKGRCYNPNDAKFKNYGARGIIMCAEWRDDFVVFLRDMGVCPLGLTLERDDVHGNYEPGNCRWATPKEQSRNRTDSVFVTVDGSKMVLKDAAALCRVSYKALHARMKYKGQSFEYAVATLPKH